jgi:hypothetical protein
MVKLALFLHFTMIAALQFFHSMIHNKVCGATSFVSAVVMVSRLEASAIAIVSWLLCVQ